MRELTMEEMDAVSGGDLQDAATLWGIGAGVAQGIFGSGWASMAAVSALGSPLGFVVIGGLMFAGGYQLLQD